ncbi:MAG TPA: DNA ligase, partial [Candidatus Limnocylindria bacterium]|nr:DNA ligase [Candidatus Limnocylindria bacterium]
MLFKLWLLLAVCTFAASFTGAGSVNAAQAPALLLANELGPQIDPAKYLISEKYDGVRALW